MSVSFRFLTCRDDVLWTVPRSFKQDSTSASGSILRDSLMGVGRGASHFKYPLLQTAVRQLDNETLPPSLGDVPMYLTRRA